MKKRIIASLALLGFYIPAITSCGGGSSEQAKLFYAYPTENLMADWDYLSEKDEYGEVIEENKEYRARDNTLRFNLMKGENESVQLIISAKQYINSFDFTLPDVTDGTNTISKDKFTVSAAWYQMVSGSNERQAFAGFYPDALIPLENYKFRRMNHIQENMNQALYFNFISDESMAAGTYKGTGVLTLDEKTYNIPFEVTIYDAVMPKKVHQKSSYLIWYEKIPLGELKNSGAEMEKKYYDFIVSKRLSPDGLPDAYESSASKFAESFADEVAYNDMIASYRFPCSTPSFNPDDKSGYIKTVKERFKPYLEALIKKNIELRDKDYKDKVNFFDKIVIYVNDEPTASSYEKVRTDDKIWYDLKIELANKLNKYSDLKESFLNMPDIVTTPYNDLLIGNEESGGVQCWCPQYQNFATKEYRDLYQSRQALDKGGNYYVDVEEGGQIVQKKGRVGGESVWWYGCMDPCSPFPSLHLDADLLNTRTIRYMQFNYKIEGCIFWSVDYYAKYTGGAETNRDIWNDPISWAHCAGDGQLVYPGVTFGIKGPITTLRLEQLLASNEEYEYLWMIQNFVNEYNKEKGTQHDVISKLEEKYFSRIYTDVICGDSDVEFNNVRLEILKLVTDMTANRDQTIEALMA
ncbi:MAG: DUF4091 domain-containing protein [Bacilli bacterium]|nr:DUF4091 domain-containing protein [Bacilli bacterium]